MKNRTLFLIWAGLYVLCAGLGFIPESQGLGTAVLVVVAALFFAPAAILCIRAAKTEDFSLLRKLRNLSIASLSATLFVLVLNLLSITAPQWFGDLLYGLLVLVSVPMMCGRYWVGSLFAWACLLFFCITQIKKKR